jgi:putative transcriptional regulator
MAISRAFLRSLAAFLLVAVFITFPAPADEAAGYVEGQLLVASPRMSDPRFARAVIYIVDHDQSGALGLMVNRELGSGPLAEFLKGFGIDESKAPNATRDIRLLSGGPVEAGALFIIHSSDFKDAAAPLSARRGIAVTRRIDALTALARGNGPAKILVILGYAGWGPGQLEEEIRNGDWITAPADKAIIFDRKLDSKWQRASEMAGVEL